MTSSNPRPNQDTTVDDVEQTLRIELAIRMRYEMEMWQANGFSHDRLEHHVDMICRRVLDTLNKEGE